MAGMKLTRAVKRGVGGGVLWAALVCGSGDGVGAEFHVGMEGNDAAPGTRMQPFRTLGRAAEAMAPGDVCVVNRGVYRETVRPPRSGAFERPLRFVAATGDTVTVSGADVLTGWQIHSGAVYRVQCAPVRQLFIDGEPALPAAGMPATGLASTGAWWQDTNGFVYARMPGNGSPTTHHIEAQMRRWGFDVSGGAHIQIQGFNLFAAGLSLKDARHCRIEDCHVWWAGGADGEAATGGEGTASLVVGGRENEVVLTSIVGSAGHGVEYTPDAVNNRLIDCLIRGRGDRAPGAVGVLASGTAQVIRHMSILDCGGGGIVCSNLLNGRIEYADVYQTGSGGRDVGTVVLHGDGKGTVLAFNWIRDNMAERGDGVVFSPGARNYIVHRNVIWGHGGAGVRLGRAAGYSFFCNNTVALCATPVAFESGDEAQFKGLRIVNNILPGCKGAEVGAHGTEGVTWQQNHTGEQPGFVDAEHRNFRLAAGSPCIDAGLEEPEFTDDYVGERPDQGAYETGGEEWTPGCRARESANQIFRPTVRLVLESVTPGAEIRYTLDGRIPTTESPLYTGAVSFVRGATVQARAFRRGMEPSSITAVQVRQND